MLRLHDTALGRVTELTLREPGKVSMYVCGPTVYGEPHIGHGRFALVFDVMRRYLEWSGLEVDYVSNITDIEDKIIAKANAEGRSTTEVVAENEASWYATLDRLNVRRPGRDPHATAYVEQMVAYVGELVDRGRAYETGDGVYLSVETVEDYGLLARQSLESMKAGGGNRVTFDDEKRSSHDFVLWKKAKPGEPAWPSPWGEGRPGWHIECTVMALDLLGEGFDLHGGGLDLAFPHHENERAQAVGGSRRFATHWVHNGLVVDEGGRKMGRSEGNVVSLPILLDQHDPRAYRMLVLRAHYRSPLLVTPATLTQAEGALERLDGMARRFPPGAAQADPADLDAFRQAMDDDLDTPRALAAIFDLVRRANSAGDSGDLSDATRAAAAVHELTAALGLELDAHGASEVDPDTQALIDQRDAARAQRDFATADALRAELEERGWTVEDSSAGTTVRR